MPQNPNQVLVGLNGGVPKPLATDANGLLFSSAVPTTVTVVQTGGTITAGGTFQSALAANPNRLAAAVHNLSVDKSAQVYLGAVADAKAGNSVRLAAGATLPLETLTGTGNAYTGVVAIDGTTAAAFVTVEVVKAG